MLDSSPIRFASESVQRQRLYGYATGESVEGVNLRVLESTVDLPLIEPVGALAPVGAQGAYFKETGETVMPRYLRAAFAEGRSVAGPALIEDDWSTTVVYPGQRCRGDRFGNLTLEFAGA